MTTTVVPAPSSRRPPLDPAVARTRLAVRRALTDLHAGDPVVVACSGGADSMALGAATSFEATRAGWRIAAVVVDHGLVPGSDAVAERVATLLRTHQALALEDVEVVRVRVGAEGGPEAACRAARYAALDEAATQRCATVVLGHTRDDQAESVLLGLARGSGPRSIAGMRQVTGVWRRPFLDIERAATVAACQALELPVWDDPTNADPRFARSRVRHRALPVLERELGPGVAAALARTAAQVADDCDELDRQAAAWWDERVDAREAGLHVAELAELPRSLRSRALRRAALEAGCPGSDLTAGHVNALDELVTGWRGQSCVELPGSVVARRVDGRLALTRSAAGCGEGVSGDQEAARADWAPTSDRRA